MLKYDERVEFDPYFGRDGSTSDCKSLLRSRVRSSNNAVNVLEPNVTTAYVL
jgi:hypothetical protein